MFLFFSMKSYLNRKTGDKTLTVMDWPPQSPDLNIIEAVWDHQDRERNKRRTLGSAERILVSFTRRLLQKTLGQSPQKSSMCLVPREIILNTDFFLTLTQTYFLYFLFVNKETKNKYGWSLTDYSESKNKRIYFSAEKSPVLTHKGSAA